MSKLPDLIKRCKQQGMNAMALTDHGNMYGIKEFLNCAKKENEAVKEAIKAQEAITNDESASPEQKEQAQRELEVLKGSLFKPILGMEAYCARRSLHDKDKNINEINPETGAERIVDSSGYHLVLLAKNKQGYRNLSKLSTIAFTEGFYSRPRIDHQVLEQHHEGLICCSACLGGEIPQLILKGDLEGADRAVRWFKRVFGDDYYIELQRHQTTKPNSNQAVFQTQQRVNPVLVELARRHSIKLIASNDVHFVEEEHGEAHDRLICISTRKDYDDPKRLHYTKQEWLKSPEQMAEIFADLPEALANTLEVAQKVESYSIDSDPLMPIYPIPEEFGTEEQLRQKLTPHDLLLEFTGDEHGQPVMSEQEAEKKVARLGGYDRLYRIKLEADYLASITYKGAHIRYGEQLTAEQEDRIRFELHTIKTMGFPGYFLIVEDYIRAAREELDVMVGPGRGSAAGSVVAYCLRITDIDPFKYNLLFERFLNPDRISLPDIDTDFDDAGRARVLEWVTNKYGKEKVAHIITYGTMASKSAIADVGRVQKLPLDTVGRIKGYIPQRFPDNLYYIDKNGEKQPLPVNLANCYKHVPEMRSIIESTEDGSAPLRDTLIYAQQLENTNRQVGMHACGVIIGPDDLSKYAPLSTIKDKDTGEDIVVTQYEGSVVESVGLIKMDFLGLKNLSVIREAVKLLANRGIKVDIDHIPLDDPKTFKLFCDGLTVGVFQFESDNMQKYLRELQPSTIEDLIAMNALYRPGPMDYIPQYIARRHGRQPITYDLPQMEPQLKETYGITVYQEQVMILSRELAGFTRGESDTLRKAMGKKQKAVLAKLEGKFLSQGQQRGHNPATLKKIWGDWVKFAEYAFNKSHATCYAWVAYQTAWLKANHPSEYMAALISCSINNNSDVEKFVKECRNMRIKVLPPDINLSSDMFSVMDNGDIRYGLLGLKGMGSSAAQSIIEARERGGPFKDIFDLVERVNLQAMNRTSMEVLLLSGALDSIKPTSRRAMLEPSPQGTYLETLLRYGTKVQAERNNPQMSLFGAIGDTSANIARPMPHDIEEWSPREMLDKEKELMGIFLSAHPLDPFRFEIEHVCSHTLENLSDLQPLEGRNVEVSGVVLSAEEHFGKNGRKFGRAVVEDYSKTFEFTFSGKTFDSYWKLMYKGNIVSIAGTVRPPFSPSGQDDRGKLYFNINSVSSLYDVRQSIRSITINIPTEAVTAPFIDGLCQVLRPANGAQKGASQGQATLRVRLTDASHQQVVNLYSRSYLINITEPFVDFIYANKLTIQVQR